MARVLYNEIYRSLRERIAEGRHPVGSFLPSEQNLVKEFSCSRMTVRKAISLLANEGLVQSIKGRGVLVLESSAPGTGKEAAFTVSGLSSFSESAHAIGAVPSSKIVYLEHVNADERLALLTGFPEGRRPPLFPNLFRPWLKREERHIVALPLHRGRSGSHHRREQTNGDARAA